MSISGVMRELWPRRILIALGAVLAIGLGLKVAGGAEDGSGIARTSVLLDTPDPQLLDPTPPGVKSLAWRATLLAEVLGAEPAHGRIARDAGIPAAQLAVVEPKLNVPTVPASLPRAAAEAAAVTPEPYVLIVRTDGVLPLISIKTTAPDREGAVRLAEAATGSLRATAALGDAPKVSRFVVNRVGAIKTRELAGDGRLLIASALAISFFGLWCAAIALVGRIGPGSSAPAGRREQLSAAAR